MEIERPKTRIDVIVANGDNKPPKKPKLGLTLDWIRCKCSNLSLPPPWFNIDYKSYK